MKPLGENLKGSTLDIRMHKGTLNNTEKAWKIQLKIDKQGQDELKSFFTEKKK